MSVLLKQSVIDLYTLASAHASLSATSSMGQLIRFEAAAAQAAADQTAALRARRVSKGMIEHLNTMADMAALVGARELEQVCEEGLKVRGESKDIGAIMAQSLVFSETLERARLAASLIFDMCEAMGIAPNGKPLPKDALDDIKSDSTDDDEEIATFEAL